MDSEAPQSGIRIQEEQNDFITQLKKSNNFAVILLDMLFKGLSIIFFILCKQLLTDSFIIHFVVITTLLASDFWYVKNPTRAISGVDATWFWAGLMTMTIFWVIMAIMNVTNPGYCILSLLGIAFSAGNLWGYFQCRRWGKAELAAMKSGGVASTISDMTTSIASGFLVCATVVLPVPPVYYVSSVINKV